MYSLFCRQHLEELTEVTRCVRALSMDAVLQAKSGHIGLPLGGAEMGTFLYFAAMHHFPADPNWIDRDRFILSAGHGSMLQYALLHLSGYAISLEDIRNFRQFHSKTPGHPEYRHTPGVECTTGPLGQGISHAVGLAIAERMLAARFNSPQNAIIDHRTYVIAGDGCLMEGISSEACSLAGTLKLNRLIVLYDANNITIDGTIDIAFTEDVAQRYLSYGWNVELCDGNDFLSIAESFDKAYQNSLAHNGVTGPTLLICKTKAGKGSAKWEGKPKIHGNPMTLEDVQEAKKALGITHLEPFSVSEEGLLCARKLMKSRLEKYQTWQTSLQTLQEQWHTANDPKEKLWHDLFAGQVKRFEKSSWDLAKGKQATRTASGKALVELARLNPGLVGGSADLAGSNLTTLPDTSFIHSKDFSGRNIHFGVREHAMAAITNGITLHGGLRGYCATFAVFSDYMRPSIRLAALMNLPTLFILTHDSIGVGEDGPTHQPVEHAAALRCIPQLNVLRPADALETFASWQQAMLDTVNPTALLLTRQDLPDLNDLLPSPRSLEDVLLGVQQGAVIIKDYVKDPQKTRLILIASGSETSLALQSALELEKAVTLETKKEFSVRVISAPSPQVLSTNSALLEQLLPEDNLIVAIEAGSQQSWGRIVGRKGRIISLDSFGLSAPAQVLFEHFGFSVARIIEKLRAF